MKKTITTLFFLIACFLTIHAQKAPFELLKLPYATNALEPVISQKTIELHHGKHLNGYVTNLNKLIKGTEYETMELKEIIAKSKQGGIFNNAGQTLNHNLYFTQFSPKGGGIPQGKLAEAINKQWGSFDNFKEELTRRGTALFGSGWIWLSKQSDGKLLITEEVNGSNPVAHGLTPLLGFDLWEHAYYLDYQNRRADHIKQLWKIIDWKVVEKRFEK